MAEVEEKTLIKIFFVIDIKAWINEGALQAGNDIMKVCVAGCFRMDVLPVFQDFLTIIGQM